MAEVGVDPDVADRVRAEYEERLGVLEVAADERVDGDGGGSRARRTEEQLRTLRLGLLDAKRRAVTDLRDANRIDDIVLREVQAVMDAEEVRLLGSVDTE